MKREWLRELETPCIVIDMKKASENIRMMQEAADARGCRLRPHIKTHKMPLFARMQMEAGASGITCAKVSEAEVMAEGGIGDIFIAYPMVGEARIRRALRLARRISRLILAVDSLRGAEALDAAAGAAGMRLEVRLEVDTGAARTGVLREQAAGLAVQISRLANLRLTGIYTFKGLILEDRPTEDNRSAGAEEGRLMEETALVIRAAGVEIGEISAGSTPTGLEAADTGKVNEIRPGTYIFKDYMLCCEHAARPEEIAARYYATVVSVPRPEYAVIDGGTKTFPMDILLDVPPYHYGGYALVEANCDLQLRRMNEEHGILSSKRGCTGLQVGDVLSLIPIHICTAINMQNAVYLDYGDMLVKEPVAARGMLV